jgi:hypothetical protein
MSSQALLIYQIEVTPPLSLNQLQTAVQAVPLSTGDMVNFGAVLVSDVTTVIGSNIVQRAITYNITSAQFQANFPGDQNAASPFFDLFTHQLGAALGMVVDAFNPTIS